jgi:hypothetical protein
MRPAEISRQDEIHPDVGYQLSFCLSGRARNFRSVPGATEVHYNILAASFNECPIRARDLRERQSPRRNGARFTEGKWSYH